MKNSESFSRELDLLGSGHPDTQELAALQTHLKKHAVSRERSDQHQIWAWTRLRAEIQNSSATKGWSWQRLVLPGLAAAALLILGVFLLSGSRSDLWIDSTGSDLYAQTFKSGDAEVVWVTGYSYIPSSYPLK